MRRRKLVLAGVAAALALPAAAVVADPPRDMALGGGQLVLKPDQEARPGEGPGDTITFSAQQRPEGGIAADGEVQFVDFHGALAGRAHSTFHGKVFCMRVDGNKAEIAWRARTQPDSGPIDELVVIDNDEGLLGEEDDLIFIERDVTPEAAACSGDFTRGDILMRGNARVDDNTP
jgi:hypothetical protein